MGPPAIRYASSLLLNQRSISPPLLKDQLALSELAASAKPHMLAGSLVSFPGAAHPSKDTLTTQYGRFYVDAPYVNIDSCRYIQMVR